MCRIHLYLFTASCPDDRSIFNHQQDGSDNYDLSKVRLLFKRIFKVLILLLVRMCRYFFFMSKMKDELNLSDLVV